MALNICSYSSRPCTEGQEVWKGRKFSFTFLFPSHSMLRLHSPGLCIPGVCQSCAGPSCATAHCYPSWASSAVSRHFPTFLSAYLPQEVLHTLFQLPDLLIFFFLSLLFLLLFSKIISFNLLSGGARGHKCLILEPQISFSNLVQCKVSLLMAGGMELDKF